MPVSNPYNFIPARPVAFYKAYQLIIILEVRGPFTHFNNYTNP